MNILILGGTADGRRLASALHQQGLPVIYSVAGLVRPPEVPCAVISGGFSAGGGLAAYLRAHRIGAVLNATHPYAATMSATAAQVCAELAIPCWRFLRPAWEPQHGDRWQGFATWGSLLPALESFRSVLLTAGQIDAALARHFADLTARSGQTQVLRTAVQPSHELPARMVWIKAIGPFDRAAERQLLQRYDIDVLVSKNSGGAATRAKLDAARERGIPVLMLERPPLLQRHGEQQFADPGWCCQAVARWFAQQSRS